MLNRCLSQGALDDLTTSLKDYLTTGPSNYPTDIQEDKK